MQQRAIRRGIASTDNVDDNHVAGSGDDRRNNPHHGAHHHHGGDDDTGHGGARLTPRPTPDQERVLIAGLLQIEPGFAAKKPDILVSRARNVCSDMLPPNSQSREQLINGAILRFTTPTIAAVTRAQGAAIVDLIRTTFCF